MLAVRAVAIAFIAFAGPALAIAPDGAEAGPAPGCAFDAIFGPWPGGGAADVHPCWGRVQPGARMTSPAGCTLAWIVRDATGNLYQATAGHCVGASSIVSADGVGRIGVVAWRMCCGLGNDMALIRLDRGVYDRVDPTLCHWGGPDRIGGATMGEKVLTYGFGTIYGSTVATRARAGVGWAMNHGDAQYVGMMQPGDSGAPVMSENGEAVGVHVQSSLSAASVRIDPSFKYATRLDVGLARAEAALGTSFALMPSSVPVALTGV